MSTMTEERLQGSSRAALRVEKKAITVGVAGNPNSGKSTLINAIAGTRLHVGNWPGVTVEKKSAIFEYGERTIRIVDLPGTYSLSPYTQEEIIARDYLVHEKPDVILNVVDATNLERNLYLTVQVMELGIPTVVALNIYDEAEKKGHTINRRVMECLPVPRSNRKINASACRVFEGEVLFSCSAAKLRYGRCSRERKKVFPTYQRQRTARDKIIFSA